MNPITVPVQSAWASKINWTQGAGFALSVLTAATGALPPQYAIFGPLIIQGVQSLATIVFRTFFTTTVTPSSAAKV